MKAFLCRGDFYMNNYLVVFRSRNETIKFVNILNSYGFSVVAVTTPRQISVSCGISAKIDLRALEIAKQIINRRQFYTFGGIYYFANNQYVRVKL